MNPKKWIPILYKYPTNSDLRLIALNTMIFSGKTCIKLLGDDCVFLLLLYFLISTFSFFMDHAIILIKSIVKVQDIVNPIPI